MTSHHFRLPRAGKPRPVEQVERRDCHWMVALAYSCCLRRLAGAGMGAKGAEKGGACASREVTAGGASVTLPPVARDDCALAAAAAVFGCGNTAPSLSFSNVSFWLASSKSMASTSPN